MHMFLESCLKFKKLLKIEKVAQKLKAESVWVSPHATTSHVNVVAWNSYALYLFTQQQQQQQQQQHTFVSPQIFKKSSSSQTITKSYAVMFSVFKISMSFGTYISEILKF